jgi:hypothetical protein
MASYQMSSTPSTQGRVATTLPVSLSTAVRRPGGSEQASAQLSEYSLSGSNLTLGAIAVFRFKSA